MCKCMYGDQTHNAQFFSAIIRSTKWKNALAVLLILGASFSIYMQTFEFPFAFDDQHAIQENFKIRDLDNFYAIREFSAQRPLVDYTFALNYHFGKLHVFGYHLINFLIHVLNGILVFFLSNQFFRKLFTEDPDQLFLMSVFSALVFVAHPIQTQAVTYISQRYTSLSAFFYLLSVLFYVIGRGIESGNRQMIRPVFFVFAVICGLLAFYCKQNAATLLLVILLIEFGCYDQIWSEWKHKLKWMILVVILFGLVYSFDLGVFSRHVQLGSVLEDVFDVARETRKIGRWQYLCTQFNVIPIYIRLLFIPIRQNLDYLYPTKTDFFDDATPFFFIFLLGIFAIAFFSRKKHPIIYIGILWFFATLSIESSIFPIQDALFEHRLYLPMFGFSLLLSYVVFYWTSSKRYWVYVIPLGIVISLAIAAYQRNEVWRTPVTLWTDVIQKAPDNYRGFTNLAHAQELNGNIDEAISNYDKAIQLKSDYSIALSNKGALIGKMGKSEEALSLFQKALKNDPDNPIVLNNIGVWFASQKKTNDAIDYFRKAIRCKPDYLDAHYNLEHAFQQIGDYENALKECFRIARINPDNAAIYNQSGILLYMLKNYAEAIKQFNQSILLDPANADVYFNKGNVLMAMQRFEEAVEAFRHAAEKNPSMVENNVNMGVAYMKMGKSDSAVHQFQKALKINPNLVEVHVNLGILYHNQGDIMKSLEHMNIAHHLKPDSSEITYYYNKILKERVEISEQ